MISALTKNGWASLERGWDIIEYVTHGNGEEYDILLRVFNGETEEGFAQKQYAHAFQESFETEYVRLIRFIQDIPDLETQDFPREVYNHEGQWIELFLVGFMFVKKGLHALAEANRTEPAEKWSYLQDDTLGHESIKHPFLNQTLLQFQKSVNGWMWAFKRELKQELGRRSYETKAKTAKAIFEKMI